MSEPEITNLLETDDWEWQEFMDAFYNADS